MGLFYADVFTKTLSYGYDADGNRNAITYPDGRTQTYTYEHDQLKTVQLPNGQSMVWDGYQWQRPGQITLPGSVQTLSYDALHNRIGSAQQPGDWQYNANNQLMQFGEGTEKTVYTYTANGHVATETTPERAPETGGGKTKTYTYDAADRLVSVHDGAVESGNEIARYAYDPFGRRISKTVGGVTTYYLYTDEGLIAELDSAGNIQVAYGWQADTMYGTAPLWQAQVSNNNLQTADYHFIITDHLGTPQMAVNQNGETTWKATSEVFGKTTPNAANQITMNLRFPGQYFDQETNTHYNYFRDYNPNIGRYVQSDPIGLRGGMNLYGYAGSNPLKYFDPLGLKKYSFNNLDCEQLARDIENQLGVIGKLEYAIGLIGMADANNVPTPSDIMREVGLKTEAEAGGYRSDSFSTKSEAYQYAVNKMENDSGFNWAGRLGNLFVGTMGYYTFGVYGLIVGTTAEKHRIQTMFATEIYRAYYVRAELMKIYEE